VLFFSCLFLFENALLLIIYGVQVSVGAVVQALTEGQLLGTVVRGGMVVSHSVSLIVIALPANIRRFCCSLSNKITFLLKLSFLS
jgi:hypothetical protein